ncbi:sin3 histone deacetylase corepressor complex component SDS3-like [Oscarella lobularis]|uniref:sin3 histone deacetylase corepressor complex component SDS3-like n=1 Tax=Oscarella lobularis TaxID=121494 RepID=UPI0033133AD4
MDIEKDHPGIVGRNGIHCSSESDEDTEEASETDVGRGDGERPRSESVQSYRDQLRKLDEGTNVEYLKKVEKLRESKLVMLASAEAFRDYEIGVVEHEYLHEKSAVKREYEIKKVEMKDNLIHDLLEEKKKVETERQTIELTGDSMDVKPVVTRKLRRRPNDPLPVQDKRPKKSAEIGQLLDEEDILDDLKAIYKGKTFPQKRPLPVISAATTLLSSDVLSDNPVFEARIDENKLIYERKVYQRGQQIVLESDMTGKINCIVHSVGQTEIIVKKNMDQMKLRIFLSQLRAGKYVIRKRSN